MIYNLEERVENFGKNTIILLQKIKQTSITKPLIEQLIRSATSIGANYFEANGAQSKKDFLHKIHLCKKESKETQFWLKMIITADTLNVNELELLLKESIELGKIFSAIAKSKDNV
jgi:four helix bundle protein